MAATLTPLARRRALNLLLLAVALAVAFLWHRGLVHALRPAALHTGGALLALCVALALFNARKKLPLLPLLKASTWLQFHLYAGWLCVGVFFLHVGFRAPAGLFETSLYVVFMAVALSGVVGLFLSRFYPSRLRMSGENLLYERIPAFRHELQEQAREIVAKSIAETKSFTLGRFYEKRLIEYFAGQRNTLSHLLVSSTPLNRLVEEMRELKRYMVPAEHAFLNEMIECVEAKDNLDRQRACQGALKYWLFTHIPLTFSLLILGTVHGLLALSFR